MGAQDHKVAMDVGAFCMNVSTSVLIVFVNKILMDPNRGHKFVFATTLCGLHFIASALAVWSAQILGFAQRAKLPLTETLYFALIGMISIASLNISLLVNSVGFYQVAKLLIIPFVCLVERFWLDRRFSMPVLASMLCVAVGVGIVVVTDVNVNYWGVVIAALSVVSSGMQQILCGILQKRHKITSDQLLGNTAPIQGVLLLAIGPFIDHMISNKWIVNFDYNVSAMTYLLLSCSVAILVNVSQYMCLGRFTAVTFQVLGHTKTIMVLMISWLFLHEHMSVRKLLGCGMAVGGMMAYGYLNSTGKTVPVSRSKEHLPLLKDEEAGEGKGISVQGKYAD